MSHCKPVSPCKMHTRPRALRQDCGDRDRALAGAYGLPLPCWGRVNQRAHRPRSHSTGSTTGHRQTVYSSKVPAQKSCSSDKGRRKHPRSRPTLAQGPCRHAALSLPVNIIFFSYKRPDVSNCPSLSSGEPRGSESRLRPASSPWALPKEQGARESSSGCKGLRPRSG